MHGILYQQVSTTCYQDIFNVDKQEYGTEHYVKLVTNRQLKVALSQLRCGVLCLKVEIEIFEDILVEYRLCTTFEENVIETESHVLLYYSKYNNQ